MSSARSIKTLGLAGLMAVMAMMVVAAVGAATASAGLPEFVLKAGKTFPVKFTSVSGEKILKIVGSSELEWIRCKKDKNTGEIINAKEDRVTITFEECKVDSTTIECHSIKPTQAAGIITTYPLKSKLVYVWPRKGKETAIDLEPVTTGGLFVEFECKTVATIIQVRKSVLGVVTPLNVFAEKFELAVKEVGGVQSPSEYEVEGSGKGTVDKLECSKNGGAFVACTEVEVTPDVITLLPAKETGEIKA